MKRHVFSVIVLVLITMFTIGCGQEGGPVSGGGGPLFSLGMRIHYRPGASDLRSGCTDGVILAGNLNLTQQSPGDNVFKCFNGDQMMMDGMVENKDAEYTIALIEKGHPQRRITDHVFVELSNGRGEIKLSRIVTVGGQKFLWFKYHAAPDFNHQDQAYVEP